MKAEFYFNESEQALFFRLSVPSKADSSAAPFELDVRATAEHRDSYPAEFAAFQEANKPAPEPEPEPIEMAPKKSRRAKLEEEVAAENREAAEVDP